MNPHHIVCKTWPKLSQTFVFHGFWSHWTNRLNIFPAALPSRSPHRHRFEDESIAVLYSSAHAFWTRRKRITNTALCHSFLVESFLDVFKWCLHSHPTNPLSWKQIALTAQKKSDRIWLKRQTKIWMTWICVGIIVDLYTLHPPIDEHGLSCCQIFINFIGIWGT